VTPPYCSAIQCLPRNLATHGAEGSEGRGKHRSLLLRNRISRFLNFNSSRIGRLRHNIEGSDDEEIHVPVLKSAQLY
jgi:hypothetical protein